MCSSTAWMNQTIRVGDTVGLNGYADGSALSGKWKVRATVASDQTKPTRENAGTDHAADADFQGERTKLGDLDRTIGAESAASGDPSPQEQIGKYEVRRLLGKGGMGAVYLGYDPLIEREVAIKVLAPALAENETNLKRFLAEARAVGKLNHANAIAIYDIGQHDGQYYIVMELAQGGSVGELLEKQQRLSMPEACRVALEAAQGLAAAHAVELIHRDVKPENLMLAADGTVKLVDFGLAKDVGRGSDLAITSAGQMLGTPYYMSPEQINGEDIDRRTDIYSLGATFYHLLTGQTPFPEQSLTKVLFAHVSAERPDPCKIDPALPPACAAIIAKALAIDPEQRYASMDELAGDLRQLLGESQAPATEVRASDTIDVADPLPRVLIVEPSKLRSQVTAAVFKKAGCQRIECLSDPHQALRHAGAERVDIVIASRQLGELQGEDLLRQIGEGSTSANSMRMLVSSDAPEMLIAEAPLAGTVAYLKKQANPDEALRAVYACTMSALDSVPFKAESYEDIRMDVVTEDGSIPPELANWIRETSLLDVTAKSHAQINDSPFRESDITICVLASGIAEEGVRNHLSNALSNKLLVHSATLAIVESATTGLRLRGLRRASFIATCECSFDRKTLVRILDVTQ